MTLWKPDTCGCEIHVTDWDNNISENIKYKCSVHENIPDSDLFEHVYRKENKPISDMRNIIRKELNITDKEDLEQEITTYGFDENRKIILECKGLTEEQKTEILKKLDPKDKILLMDLKGK